jgi:hypothetical protein
MSGPSNRHDLVTVPRPALADLFSNPSPRAQTVHSVRAGETSSASEPALSVPE